MPEMYKILERGTDANGSWARYLDARGKKCHIGVRRGLDLEAAIKRSVEERERKLQEWEARPPEEQERLIRELRETYDRFEACDGMSAWFNNPKRNLDGEGEDAQQN